MRHQPLDLKNMPGIREAIRLPMLSWEEERELLAKAQRGNRVARQKIVQTHLLFVLKRTNRWKHTPHDLEDLFAEGLFGLNHAIDKFDLKTGNKFLTYAAHWIECHIKGYVIDNHAPVKMSTEDLKKFWSETDRVSVNVVSLESVILSKKNELVTLGDVISDQKPNPEVVCTENGERVNAQKIVAKMLDGLSFLEANVIRQRFLQEEPVTLAEVGKEIGISGERVRQIQMRALNKMIRKVNGEGNYRDVLSRGRWGYKVSGWRQAA